MRKVKSGYFSSFVGGNRIAYDKKDLAVLVRLGQQPAKLCGAALGGQLSPLTKAGLLAPAYPSILVGLPFSALWSAMNFWRFLLAK